MSQLLSGPVTAWGCWWVLHRLQFPFSNCRRLWGSVALAQHTAMGPRLCGISVATSRLQGLCCKAGSSALLNPCVDRLWDLVPVPGQSGRKAGIQTLRENQLSFMEPEMFWVKPWVKPRCFLGETRVWKTSDQLCLVLLLTSPLKEPCIRCCTANTAERLLPASKN